MTYTVLMHFPVQKFIVNAIDFTDLVFLATSVHVIFASLRLII